MFFRNTSFMAFEGNTKYTNKRLGRATELQAGKLLGAADEFAAKNKIVELYTDDKFADVTVTTELQKTERPGFANLIFKINEGCLLYTSDAADD